MRLQTLALLLLILVKTVQMDCSTALTVALSEVLLERAPALRAMQDIAVQVVRFLMPVWLLLTLRRMALIASSTALMGGQ